MRRYISLACVAMVVIMCMVSPVSASETSDVIDVLSYGFPNNSSSNTIIGTGEITATFALPFYTQYYFVDVLLFTDSLTSASFTDGNAIYGLTVVPIADGYYRVYGEISGYNNALSLIVNGSMSFVTFISLRVSSRSYHYFDIEAYCNIVAHDYNQTIHYVPTDDINYRTFLGSSDYSQIGYQLFIWSDEWRKYDYIDILINSSVDSVTSVNCTIGGIVVPHEISYLDNDPMVVNDYCYSIRVDLTSIDRSIDDFPQIIIMGNVSMEQVNLIGILSCVGIVSGYVPDSIEYKLSQIYTSLFTGFSNLNLWIQNQTSSITASLSSYFSNLSLWISNQTKSINERIDSGFLALSSWISIQTSTLESAIRGDTTAGDSFQQEVVQKDQQLNDIADVMDSVSKPQIDSVNVSADTYVDQTVLATSMSGLTTVISMPVFQNVIMMALIMATAGYVLFGKR